MRTTVIIALLAAVTGLSVGGVLAGNDHDEARRLRAEDDILPLEALLETAGVDRDARILEVETEFEHGRRVYEIEYVTAGGRVMEVLVDARTGQVLGHEED